MRASLLSFLITIIVFSAGSAFADDAGVYVGVGGGSSRSVSMMTSSEIDAAYAAAGITSNSSIDSNDKSWKAFAGYKINKYLAIEGGYSNLGEFSSSSIVTASPYGIGRIEQHISCKALDLAAVVIFPLPYSFEVYGKLGVSRWQSDANVTEVLTSLSTSQNYKEKGTSSFFGLGIGYRLTDNLMAHGEWDRFANISNLRSIGASSDVDALTLGVSFNF